MPPSDMGVPIGAIRNAAAQAVKSASLRTIAADMGLSHSGLSEFINRGRKPQPATVRKLVAWYARHQASQSEFSADDARTAVFVLLDTFPEPRYARVAGKLLDYLAELYRQERVSPPAWLDELRRPG